MRVFGSLHPSSCYPCIHLHQLLRPLPAFAKRVNRSALVLFTSVLCCPCPMPVSGSFPYRSAPFSNPQPVPEIEPPLPVLPIVRQVVMPWGCIACKLVVTLRRQTSSQKRKSTENTAVPKEQNTHSQHKHKHT